MLTFRNTLISFTLLLLLIGACDIFWGISGWFYAVLFLAGSSVLFYGCYSIQSGFFMPVLCAAQTTEKKMALSFDDGPSNANTLEILEVLRSHQVKAAFFCIGKKITKNEAILKKIKEDGHLIGNHSYSHSNWFDLFTSQKMLDDMKKMDEMTMSAAGIRPRLFRPPFGVMNPNLKKAIVRGNFTPVGWSIRSLDTVTKDPEKLRERICRSFHPGAVILLHDTCKVSAEALSMIIRDGRSQGYEWERLDILLNIEPYA